MLLQLIHVYVHTHLRNYYYEYIYVNRNRCAIDDVWVSKNTNVSHVFVLYFFLYTCIYHAWRWWSYFFFARVVTTSVYTHVYVYKWRIHAKIDVARRERAKLCARETVLFAYRLSVCCVCYCGKYESPERVFICHAGCSVYEMYLSMCLCVWVPLSTSRRIYTRISFFWYQLFFYTLLMYARLYMYKWYCINTLWMCGCIEFLLTHS